jgi:ABC-type transport system involved in multi-copper enzyme maturation permease subunit
MTAPATALDPNGRPDHQVTLARVVGSELTKLRSLRSTWIMLGVVTASVVSLALAGGRFYASFADSGELTPTSTDATWAPFLTYQLAGLIVASLGAISITGEYSTGSIRATFTAVPRRVPVLWAKAVALVVVAGPVMLAANLASFLGFQLLAGSYGIPLTAPGAVQAIISATMVAVAFGLFGLGIGAALRSPVASIITLVILMFVVQSLVIMESSSALNTIKAHLPAAVAWSIIKPDPAAGLGQLAGDATMLVGWVILVCTGGIVSLKWRDT